MDLDVMNIKVTGAANRVQQSVVYNDLIDVIVAMKTRKHEYNMYVYESLRLVYSSFRSYLQKRSISENMKYSRYERRM